MTPRLVASAVWAMAIVVAPVRVLLKSAAKFAWPQTRLFTALRSLHPDVPLAIMMTVMYGATVVALRYGLRVASSVESDAPRSSRRWLSRQSPESRGVGVLAVLCTLGWVMVNAMTGTLTRTMVAIAGLVIVGVWPGGAHGKRDCGVVDVPA